MVMMSETEFNNLKNKKWVGIHLFLNINIYLIIAVSIDMS